MTPYYERNGIVLLHGDCREVMATLAECSVDAIVTDPPYELGFMGKGWDNAGVAYDSATWAAALRVLKPGGHMLAFGAPRNYHRMTCAIEDAGFEIRDSLMYIFGSGFPKSLNVSKALDSALDRERAVVALRQGVTRTFDVGAEESVGPRPPITAPASLIARQWDGWGTALKPAYEPIVLARKPLEGTVAGNVIKWGTGALNIDGTRIHADDSGGSHGGIREADARGCPVHDLPSLQPADAEGAIDSRSCEDSRDLQSQVSRRDDVPRAESSLRDGGLGGLSQRLSVAENGAALAGGLGLSPDSSTEGRLRAPSCDGAEDRASVEALGDGAPQERYQERQSPGEPGAYGLVGPLKGAPGDRAPDGGTVRGKPDASCTCGRTGATNGRLGEDSAERRYGAKGIGFQPTPGPLVGSASGRWPANVLLDDVAAVVLDAQSGPRLAGGNLTGNEPRSDGFSGPVYGDGVAPRAWASYAVVGGASRFFYTAKTSRAEREFGLDDLDPSRRSDGRTTEHHVPNLRTSARRNDHPTVKPVDLMRWLCRLVTPPGGTILDPFLGSGSTGMAALDEGFRFIGIDLEPHYLDIAQRRITRRHLIEPLPQRETGQGALL